MKLVIIYVIFINVITFLTFAADKRKAINGEWRIKETVLFGLAVIGGGVGGVLAMLFLRHKTHKPQFMIGLPVIIVVHIILIVSILL